MRARKKSTTTTTIITGCRKIVDGTGEGKALVTDQPINFLTMVEARTGRITDTKHELFGMSLKDAVLVLPRAVGSSVGAYVIYSLKEHRAAPSAVVCARADITTASGCAIAGVPAVDLPNSYGGGGSLLSKIIRQGSNVRVEAGSGRIIIITTTAPMPQKHSKGLMTKTTKL